MPTIEQIRAARALIGWSQGDLAERADLSQTGIARIENGTNKPNSQTLAKIQTAFDKANVEFIDDNGVKKRTGEIKTLSGKSGLTELLDDIHEVGRISGGQFCLHNADPDNWYKWLGKEWFQSHADRMALLSDKVSFRILAEEGNTNLISTDFAEYRWFPKEKFNDQSMYAYGDRLAFVNFSEEDVTIRILQKQEFADSFKVLFDIAWDTAAIKI